MHETGRLQEDLCLRIPESEKKNLRIALGLERDEVSGITYTSKQKLEKSNKAYLQEEEDADPFAVRERNVFKEYWDDFVGWLYSLRAKQQMGSQAS